MKYVARIIFAMFATSLLFTQVAEAKNKPHHQHKTQRIISDKMPVYAGIQQFSARVHHRHGKRSYSRRNVNYGGVSVAGGRPSGCPHAWCGCGTSLHVFGRIIPELNLASNWRRFPPASPGAGMVAWRNGHVMAITGGGPGAWTVYNPNSGDGVAHVHTTTLAGYHIVNPNGGIASNHIRTRHERHTQYASNSYSGGTIAYTYLPN